MNELPIQAATLVMSLAGVVVWWRWGRARGYGALAIMPISVFVLTALFYVVVIFTDLNELYHDLFTLISAGLRLYSALIFLFGAVIMLRRHV